jgi:ligand-binding SRPBCC domain-containing protein
MPNILHRLSIDAPPEHVHQFAATKEGIQLCSCSRLLAVRARRAVVQAP